MNPGYCMRSVVIACAFWIGGCSDRTASPSTPTAVVPSVADAMSTSITFDLPAHSDDNWVNGIAKTWGTAYFVMLKPGVQESMTSGTQVTFADGSTRVIQSTRVNGDTLIVNLDGPPLDGKMVGHPHKIRFGKPHK